MLVDSMICKDVTHPLRTGCWSSPWELRVREDTRGPIEARILVNDADNIDG